MRSEDCCVCKCNVDFDKIVKAITKSVREDLPDYRIKNHNTTNNATNYILQDIMNTNVDLVLGEVGFKKIIFRRGSWNIIFWYDRTNKIALSVMPINKYNRVKKHESMTHYIKVLVEVQNRNIIPKSEQLCLFTDPDYEIKHGELRDGIFQKISGDAQEILMECQHGIITYLFDGDDVNNIDYILPSYDFGTYDKKSLNEYIEPNLMTMDNDSGIISESVKRMETSYRKPIITMKADLLSHKVKGD